MSHRINILLPVIFLLLWIQSRGQGSDYQLQTFGTRDGLLSPKIFALAQDGNRQLWIGTEAGVSRYNGYQFANFRYTSDNEPIGRILCIAEDSLHGIWIGGDKGLFYLSGENFRKVQTTGKSSLAVETLLTDSRGNLWIGDLLALFRMNPSQVQQVAQNPPVSIPLSPYADFHKRVYQLSEDREQNIYAASFDGIFVFPDGSTKYQLKWLNNHPVNPVLSVAAISPDSIFWNPIRSHPMQMINGNTYSVFTEDYIGTTVFKHKQEVYGLTTRGVGKLVNGKVETMVSVLNIANNALAAMIDAEDNIWVGTWEGLLKFSKTSFRQYITREDNHKEVFSMLEERNGALLFGSNRGLVLSSTGSSLAAHPAYPRVFKNAEVLCMAATDDGSIWFGSGYQGIARLKNGRLTNWMASDTSKLKDNNCEALYPAPDGQLYACTENGVTLIDAKAPDPFVAHYPFKTRYARYPELFGCFQPSGQAARFYGSQGLFILQHNELTEEAIAGMPVQKLYITRIIQDKKGNVWVATQGKGLLRCAFENNKLRLVKAYDLNNQLHSDIALSVLADKNNDIWTGDYNSLSVLINPGPEEQLITFNEKDGLLSSYYQTLKLEQQSNGTIWGLTSMGTVSFHPDSIRRNNLTPSLSIEQILADGKNVLKTGTTQFSYNLQVLQFVYTAISLTDPSNIRYAYRIPEIDSAWTYTSSRQVSINFLRPGKYTFELIASNNNNYWTPVPWQYMFTIRPPLWQTWWFRLAILTLIGLLVFGLMRRRIQAIKSKAAVRQQLAELEAKAIRSQMNPHFIFNSLNAIQESIVLNDFDTSYEYLSKFSKLLRQVLNNSEKNLITLRDEIEMNRLYLELESLRFKHSFSYSITIEDTIDPELVVFPSLLLQPFIENAIWHGLLQKEGQKTLTITFSQAGPYLRCTIEDNGIGREAAAAIKKQKLGSQYFESKGTHLSLQRLRLLQDSGAMEAKLNMTDLPNGTGTIVELLIPLSLNNNADQ